MINRVLQLNIGRWVWNPRGSSQEECRAIWAQGTPHAHKKKVAFSPVMFQRCLGPEHDLKRLPWLRQRCDNGLTMDVRSASSRASR